MYRIRSKTPRRRAKEHLRMTNSSRIHANPFCPPIPRFRRFAAITPLTTKICISVYSILSVERTSRRGTLHYIGLRGYSTGGRYADAIGLGGYSTGQCVDAISLISENVPGPRPSHIS